MLKRPLQSSSGKVNRHTFTILTQQIKPEKYPEVEDEATVILTYPQTQVIIQASWNWSHNRKDMEIYGTTGYLICQNDRDMLLMEKEADGPFALSATPGLHDPFAFLTKVVKEGHAVEPFGLASLENNLVVMQILEAAKKAAETGQTVAWNRTYATE